MAMTTLLALSVFLTTPMAALDYPPIVKEKTLYAKNDFRGRKAPELVVEKWLTAKPETKGKVLIVDFWATWCGPCRALIPKLNQWQAKFKSDVVIVGISDEPEATVEDFKASNEIAYAEAIDTRKRMSNAIGVQGIPHVLVITPDGIVRWQGFPGSKEDPLDEAKVATIVKAWKASQG